MEFRIRLAAESDVPAITAIYNQAIALQSATADTVALNIKTLFAILLDINADSFRILEKFGFRQWGHMPNVADFDGRECGHLYYGLRVAP
ncbi:MAG: hypothetical protein QNJ73_12105 [Gammaproteobacteria bacterium]|nr:hypothetical protein [Gammaproteobacteria bacterium]